MNYRKAKYIDKTRIDCEISHPTYGWIPYTVDPADRDMTVNNKELLSKMAANTDVAPYVAPTQEELKQQKSDRVRQERDEKLVTEVDPLAGNALRWADLTEEKQGEWAEYRKLLLDVPQQSNFPTAVAWPTKP